MSEIPSEINRTFSGFGQIVDPNAVSKPDFIDLPLPINRENAAIRVPIGLTDNEISELKEDICALLDLYRDKIIVRPMMIDQENDICISLDI